MSLSNYKTDPEYKFEPIHGELRQSSTSCSIGNFYRNSEPIRPIEGNDLHFTINEYNFDGITRLLVDHERSFGFSSLEMFNRYINNEFENNLEIEDWFNLFLLYLGTKEIRNISCP